MNLSKLSNIAIKGDRIASQVMRILWPLLIFFLVMSLFIIPVDDDQDRATVGKIIGVLFVIIMTFY